MNKILVCGNGPSLKKQLKGASLDGFFVVRVNLWKAIDGYDNRVDAWLFWPWDTRLSSEGFIFPDCELWLSLPQCLEKAEKFLNRKIDYTLPMNVYHQMVDEWGGKIPFNGTLAVSCAMLKSDDVYVAGFDHHKARRTGKGDSHYYEKGLAGPIHHHHDPLKDEKWMNNLLETAAIRLFKKENTK